MRPTAPPPGGRRGCLPVGIGATSLVRRAAGGGRPRPTARREGESFVTKTVVSLSDRYTQTEGQVFLSSMQALVRLPLDQARADRAAGLTTAGYVTGYRGSPITTLDAQLWSARALLEAHDIHFEPGLNEELAATSLRGAQQLDWYGKPREIGRASCRERV